MTHAPPLPPVLLDLGAAGQYRTYLRRALYGDVEQDTAEAALAMLTRDTPARIFAEATLLTEQGCGSVRRTYVLCRQDLAVRPALQRRFISEAAAAHPRSPTAVVEMDASHSPFLSRPGNVTEVIAQAR